MKVLGFRVQGLGFRACGLGFRFLECSLMTAETEFRETPK